MPRFCRRNPFDDCLQVAAYRDTSAAHAGHKRQRRLVADQQVGTLDQPAGLRGQPVQPVIANADDVDFFRGVHGGHFKTNGRI